MPWSTHSPSASRKAQCTAVLGSGSRPITALAISGTFGPLTRTIPMPPRPGGVATAATVAGTISPPGMGRLVAVEHALDLPLLKDREDIVDQPVKHQSGREKEEKHAEHER